MSTKYKESKDVPIEAICKRLDELATAVTKGKASIDREFTMRVPAELDRDADLVLSEASKRIKELKSVQIDYPQIFFTVQWMLKNNNTEGIEHTNLKEAKKIADMCYVDYLKET